MTWLWKLVQRKGILVRKTEKCLLIPITPLFEACKKMNVSIEREAVFVSNRSGVKILSLHYLRSSGFVVQ